MISLLNAVLREAGCNSVNQPVELFVGQTPILVIKPTLSEYFRTAFSRSSTTLPGRFLKISPLKSGHSSRTISHPILHAIDPSCPLSILEPMKNERSYRFSTITAKPIPPPAHRDAMPN